MFINNKKRPVSSLENLASLPWDNCEGPTRVNPMQV